MAMIFLVFVAIFALQEVSLAVDLQDIDIISFPSPDYASRLSRLESLLLQQSQDISDLETLLLKQASQIVALKQQVSDKDSEIMVLKAEFQATCDVKAPTGQRESEKHEIGLNRDVRTDDGGPVEIVVTQLSQHVTQLDASLQAFKAQTTLDLNTATQQATQNLHNLQVQTTASLNALTHTNALQDLAIENAQTSTFVHWGSSTCYTPPQGLVYAGIIGGSPFNETGAATNFLCLTLNPTFGGTKTAYGGHLYGTEYETQDVHSDKDPVCAVCRTSYTTTIMIPGTNHCGTGWYRQYYGYLMSGGFGDGSGSEFICVDQALENTDHGDQNQNGKSLFYTSTHCGSLPCTPYEDNKTVLCAVCST